MIAMIRWDIRCNNEDDRGTTYGVCFRFFPHTARDEFPVKSMSETLDTLRILRNFEAFFLWCLGDPGDPGGNGGSWMLSSHRSGSASAFDKNCN